MQNVRVPVETWFDGEERVMGFSDGPKSWVYISSVEFAGEESVIVRLE